MALVGFSWFLSYLPCPLFISLPPVSREYATNSYVIAFRQGRRLQIIEAGSCQQFETFQCYWSARPHSNLRSFQLRCCNYFDGFLRMKFPINNLCLKNHEPHHTRSKRGVGRPFYNMSPSAPETGSIWRVASKQRCLRTTLNKLCLLNKLVTA